MFQKTLDVSTLSNLGTEIPDLHIKSKADRDLFYSTHCLCAIKDYFDDVVRPGCGRSDSQKEKGRIAPAFFHDAYARLGRKRQPGTNGCVELVIGGFVYISACIVCFCFSP